MRPPLRRSRSSFKIDKVSSQDNLMLALRASFSSGPCLSATKDWLKKPLSLPPILAEMSSIKAEEEERKMTLYHDYEEARMRKLIMEGSSYAHPRDWQNGKLVEKKVSDMLWRTPDPTPNERPVMSFRPRFILPHHQPPWKQNDEFPQASTKMLSVHDPVHNTTHSYKRIVEPLVRSSVSRIDAELSTIPDDGTTASVGTLRESVRRSRNEMASVLEKVQHPRDRAFETAALITASIADDYSDDAASLPDYGEDREATSRF